MKAMFAPEDQRAAAYATVFEKDVPALFGHLERKLKEGNKFYSGNNLKWVDFVVAGWFTNAVLNPKSKNADQWAAAWANAGPKLKAYIANF